MNDHGHKRIGLGIPREASFAKNQSSKMSNRTISFTEWMDKRSTSDTPRPPTSSPTTQNLIPVKIEPSELVLDSSNKEILFNNKFQIHHSKYHPEVPFSPPNQVRNAMKKPDKVKLDLKQRPIIPTRTHSGLKRKAICSEQIQPSKSPVAPSSMITNKKAVDSLVCDLCKVICSSPMNMTQHLKGRQHKAKMEYTQLEKGAEGGWPRCDVCQIWCSNWGGLEMHFKGQKHKAKLQESENSEKSVILCELCHVPCLNEELYEAHLKGKQHARREDDRAARVTARTKSLPYKFANYVIG